ncbi:MAG: hypothetical protein H0Z40_04795 [Desulfotomaculum sp.]|nr:hypothetical protein [Desulfotomaculum sp.]
MGRRKRIKKRKKVKKNKSTNNKQVKVKAKQTPPVKPAANNIVSLDTGFSGSRRKKIKNNFISSFVPRSCTVPTGTKAPLCYPKTCRSKTKKSSFKIRKRHRKFNNFLFVPQSCITEETAAVQYKKNSVKQPVKMTGPPTIKTVSIFYGPMKFRLKKRFDSKKSFIPESCIIKQNSICPNENTLPRNQRKYTPVPLITGLKTKPRKVILGNNKVIVPHSCIIKPTLLEPIKSYDWRKSFPRPICLEKAAAILGPTIKFRQRRQGAAVSSFVPTSCIIAPAVNGEREKSKPEKDDLQTTAEEALAQLPPQPEKGTGSNLFLLAGALIIIVSLVIYIIK